VVSSLVVLIDQYITLPPKFSCILPGSRFPQKKAPAARLRATERVQGRRTATRKGLTQPVIPIMLSDTMRTLPRGSVGWR
jgi:hypothetical protein